MTEMVTTIFLGIIIVGGIIVSAIEENFLSFAGWVIAAMLYLNLFFM